MQKRNHLLIILLGILVAGLCFTANAQEEEHSYTVEIITEEDGHRKVFKKSYSAPQAFKHDEDYKTFFGDNPPRVMIFKDDSLDRGKSNWHQFFDLQNEDSVFTFRFDKDRFLHNKDSLLKAMDRHLEALDEHLSNLDFDIRWEDDADVHFRYFNRANQKVSIEDFDENEDKAFIKQNNLSLINDIHIYEMNIRPAARGEKLSIKFRTDVEAPLSLKIYDEQGNVFFNESLVSFRGFYDRDVDLAGVVHGTYILDIVRGKSKYSKKLVIKE